MYNPTMKEMPDQERPMEKLIRNGADALSVEELLAILIGTGTPKRNALDLAVHILRNQHGRAKLLNVSADELSAFEGIGKAKSCRIIAGIHLGKRLMQDRDFQLMTLNSPASIYEYFSSVYLTAEQEIFSVLVLDTKSKPIYRHTVSMGTVNETLVHPREVFRMAIRMNAHAVVLVHNHPTGDPEPSIADRHMTTRLRDAGAILGIQVMDHIIVGKSRYVSFKERGFL